MSTRKLEGLPGKLRLVPLENDFAGLGLNPRFRRCRASRAKRRSRSGIRPHHDRNHRKRRALPCRFRKRPENRFSSSTRNTNRRAVANIARGRRVLDCFTHTGSFALNALPLAEPSTYMRVDISQLAVDMAESNARLNGFANHDFRPSTCFVARNEAQKKHRTTSIILDPPAFEEPQDHRFGYAWLPRDQLPRHAPARVDSKPRLLALHGYRPLPQNARERGARCRRSAAPNRGTPTVARPSHRMGRTGNHYLKFFLFQVV